jgi:hypothetical protein
MTVGTIHVPQKWSFASKVEWHYEWIENPLVVALNATNPANREAFYEYPLLRFDSVSVAPQYRQYVKNQQQGGSGQSRATGAIQLRAAHAVMAQTASATIVPTATRI